MKSKDDRKSYPLRLPKATLKALKHRALERETSVQKILEQLIEEYLATDGPGVPGAKMSTKGENDGKS